MRPTPSGEPYVALQVLMMPKDTNRIAVYPREGGYSLDGTIFGGVLLSYIDQAGAIGAFREIVRAGGNEPHLVTVAINRVEFLKPVLMGDVVRFAASVEKFGRTSVTMRVRVEAERGMETIHVTDAELVYVNVDPSTPERRPRPLFDG